MVEDYQAARARAEAVRDEETIGYPTENRNYARDNGMVTFQSWLEGLAGTEAYARYPGRPDETRWGAA